MGCRTEPNVKEGLAFWVSNLFRSDSYLEQLFRNSYGFTELMILFPLVMKYALQYSDKSHIPKSRWKIKDTISLVTLTILFQKVALLMSKSFT